MADEKKPEAKPAPPEEKDAFVEIVSLIVVVMLLMALVNNLVAFVNSNRLFANGWRGLTPKGILLAHTLPISSIENPIGAKVINVNDANVYDAPGGKKIGKQKITARGTILQGPVEIGGERYWYVDYESGPDGWVRESDIAYLQSEPNLIERMIISLLVALPYLKILLFLFVVVLIFWIVYLFRKIGELRVAESKLLYPQSAEVVSAVNPQWQRILDHSESFNENDWRQAILEADIMLGDILDRLSLPGDTIGDKLKAVERSDFTTIDNAWEAHKIRNQIAHEGSAFILTQRETRRVIDLYRSVFEEFQII